MLGSGIEYYDIALYGYLAPVLIKVFLPHLSKSTAYFFYFSFELFAALFQYFGAKYYGQKADLYGRKNVICQAMMGTSVVTGAICFLPTYEQIGIIATLLFCFARMMQGFFLGGEYNGGAIYCLENESNKNKHGFISGLYCSFTVLGIITASIVATGVNFLGHEYFRMAYGISFLFVIIVYYIRKKLKNDMPVLNKKMITPVAYPHIKLAMIAIAALFFGIIYGFPTKIFNVLLPMTLNIDVTNLMIINSLFLFLYMLCLMLFGCISDIYGANKVMYTASGITMLIGYPLCAFIETGALFNILLIKTIFTLLAAAFVAPIHLWAQNLFPRSNRYRNISSSYTIGKCFSTLLLAISFLTFEHTHNLKSIGVILLMVSLMTTWILYQSSTYLAQPITQ